MPLFPPTLPFILHTLIEIPASINFFLNPSSQLRRPAQEAKPIIRQYATLLFASSLISLVFCFRGVDDTSRNVAGALAVYHAAPFSRAGWRILCGEPLFGWLEGKALGGPGVHFLVHGVCFGVLSRLYLQSTLP